MNKWLCVGNIASDPNYRTTPNGVSCCTFRVACQRKYKNQSGVYEADFINCVAWRQTADFIHKYFLKGHKIGFSATLQSRSYDAQDGSKRYVTEAIVEEVEFVAPRSDSSGSSYGAPPPSAPSQPAQRNEQQRMDLASQGFQEVEDDDELPF